jgi:lipopolysaccharide/colanic/teichoic acid biosynthesis glycosyltransferase
MNKEIISILDKDKKEILNHHDLLFMHDKRIKRIENILFYLIVFIVIFNILLMIFFYFYNNKQEPFPSSFSQNQ